MIPPEALARARAVLHARTESFVALTKVGGLDPARAFRGADLRRVVFTAEDDVSGFDFRGADLREADVRLARGLAAARWEGARLDGVRWPVPDDFDQEHAESMILAGHAPPPHWERLIQRLNFTSKQISSINPIANLTNLERLYLDNTQVADLSPIASLTNLKLLQLNNTQVTDLRPVAGLAKLLWLYLDGTRVADLSPIASLANLQGLSLDKTPITDLSPIAGRKGLSVYWQLKEIDAGKL